MNSWIRGHTKLVEVIIVSIILLVLGWNVLSQYQTTKENERLDNLIDKINNEKNFPTGTSDVPEYEKNAYINVSPEKIKRGEYVTFAYGYLDKLNNEHLKSATTTVTVQAPDGKKYIADFAKIFPDDFPNASSYDVGGYIVNVERKVKRTDGKDEILYRAINFFIVDE